MTQSLQHNKSLVSLNQVFIFFFMVVATDIFAIIPMLGYFMIPIYMVFYPILLFFYAIYLLDNSLVKRKFIALDLLILFLLIMPFYSAFMANRVFGQSLYVGVKNMMPFFTVVSASLTLYMLKVKIITLKHLENTFVAFAWMNLLANLFINIAFDPGQFPDEIWVGNKEVKGGFYFKLWSTFIVFGGVYYLAKFFHTRQTKHLLYFVPFLAYMVFLNSGRTMMFVFAMVCLAMLWRELSLKKIVLYGMVFLCVASVVVFILYLAESEALDVLVSMYMSYFYGLVGMESGDNSADSRILQLAIVTAFFLDNPGAVFHGAGFLTVDGYEEQFGRFYPTDLGLIGVVMIFGIVVAILLYVQFIYAFLLSRRIKDHNSILLNCSKYMILNYFLTSFFTGNIYKSPSIVVLFIAVIIAHGFPKKSVESG